MTYLITGATGAVGRPLVDELLARGADVRALTRDASKAALPEAVDVVEGDLGDPSAALFDGVDAVFLFPADGVDTFVERAVGAGVDRFVVLSSLAVSAEFPRDIGSTSNLHHSAIERAVTSRTERWTMLRPGTFANNLLSWAWPIKSGQPVRAPYVSSAQAPIHEADVAAAAATVLTEPGHEGAVYELTGPEALTRVQQVEAISAAVGREIELVEITPDEFRQEVSQFIPEPVIAMLLDYWRDTVSQPDVPRSAPGLTGVPARTLAQWAIDHRAEFVD
jgi:uncharacterized protein YbjT (DUF2867 family)